MTRLAILGGEPAVSTPDGDPPGIPAEALQSALRLLRAARTNAERLADFEGTAVTRRFEERFAALVGAEYAVATSSGTAALVAALLACGVAPGHEVIVSTYGWGGTAGAVLVIGATPVFVDIDPCTFNMDPEAARAACSARTRAILATHLFGHPADISKLTALAAERGVRLILDAAQALGATYADQPIGAWGDVTAFSFGRGKVLTTGEGGMAVTNDAEIYERLLLASQHPVRALAEIQSPSTRAWVDEVSLSCRMHPVAAAIGATELQRVPSLLQARRTTCLGLSDALTGIPGFRTPCEAAGTIHAFHAFPLTYLAEDLGGASRDIALRALHAEGVPVVAGPVRCPIHLRARFRASHHGSLLKPSLGSRVPNPVSAPVAERRCAGEEVLLESSSRWLAHPARRIEELRRAFEKLAAQCGSLAGVNAVA